MLTDEEKEKFAFVLNEGGKTELEGLWKYLCQEDFTEKEADKSELYLHLTGRPFRPSDDQYLRTRLSQLNKMIEQFLAREYAGPVLEEAGLGDEDVLLRLFLRRRQYALFEKSWKRLLNRAEKQQRHDQLVQLYQLYFEYVRYHLGIGLDKLGEVKSLLQQAVRQNLLHFLETHGKLACSMAYIDRILHVADEELESNALVPIPEPGKAGSWPPHIRFLFEWGESYYLRGEEKIIHLKGILEWREKALRFPVEEKQQHAIILATIALEYFFLEDYKQADEYYQKVFQLTGKDPEPYFLDILYNYFSNLLAIERYRQAVDYYHEYEKAILNSRRHAFRFQFLAALAHLFLDDTSKAFEVMSQEIYQLPEYESVYGRIIFAFIYYQWHEHEQAERELNNLLQKIRYKAPPFPDIELTTRLFLKFLRMIDKPLGRRERQARRQQLLEEADEAIGPAHNVFLLKCLRREIARH